tara:strand:- start:3989 stop:4414 length:426 start_codon:yes stop_codon:yes gene_type:complete
MLNTMQHVAGLALLGTLLTGCSDSNAATTDTARELREARDALGDWSEMKAEQFEQAAGRALRATEQQIATLRDKVANSEAADDARATLADLEARREQLVKDIAELSNATGEKLAAARRSIVDSVNDVTDRLGKAWQALTHK